MCFRLPIFLLAFVLVAAMFASIAQASLKGSGLPLPRFVSLRADKVNMRAGPGVQYPIEWVYHRRYLPLEVIVEYKTWRKVRDWRGTWGWIHQSMLTGQRSIIVTDKTQALRSKPNPKSKPIAMLKEGVVGKLIECPSYTSWCEVEAGSFSGWMRRADFWGVHSAEVVD